MNNARVSRRDALKMTGTAAVVGGLAAQAASAGSKSEIDAVRDMIGQRFSVAEGEMSARFELEEVVPLGPRVRAPLGLPMREPYAVVFRNLGGDDLKDGTYRFSSGLGSGLDIMVSHFVGNDGAPRLEATFN